MNVPGNRSIKPISNSHVCCFDTRLRALFSLAILELEHAHYYNISVRAFNRLGQSVNQTFLRVRTDDVPIRKEGMLSSLSLWIRWGIHSLLDLPIIEHAAVHPSDKTINYRLNNASFAASKAPLCLRLEIHNQTNLCPRIVTPSGFFKLDEYEVQHIHNVSLCLDQYDGYCGKSVPVATSKYPLYSEGVRWVLSLRFLEHNVSDSWIFILIAAVTMVSCLILLGLGLFCFILRRKRRRNAEQDIGNQSRHPVHLDQFTVCLEGSSSKKSSQHPIVTESVVSSANRFD